MRWRVSSTRRSQTGDHRVGGFLDLLLHKGAAEKMGNQSGTRLGVRLLFSWLEPTGLQLLRSMTNNELLPQLKSFGSFFPRIVLLLSCLMSCSISWGETGRVA